MARDVLEHDDRVVDQDADDQREPHQRDDVEREAEAAFITMNVDEQRRRDRDHDDDRVAPRVQEQHQHDRGQDDAFDQALQHAVERLLRVVGRRARPRRT